MAHRKVEGMETKYQYLELIYKEALNQVRCHIDSRYKILQFVGVYNAAIMTFGLRDMDIFKGSIKGVLVLACRSLLQ